jgi:hypothetical protein
MSIELETPKHITSLRTSAILVGVEMTASNFTKSDRGIASRISKEANAKANVTKVAHELLANDPDLRVLLNHRQTVYNFLDAWTLPWMGKLRLLPSSSIEKFMVKYDSLEKQFYELLDTFLTKYEDKIAGQAFTRGDFFNRNDYPTLDQVRGAFTMKLYHQPVPENDFRVQVANDQAADLQRNFQKQVNDKVQEAHGALVEKLVDVMQSLSHCCEIEEVTGKDGEIKIRRRKIYDSTVEKAMELCETLETFNPLGDARLDEARTELYRTLRTVDAPTLRDSDSARARVKADVDSILSKFC